MAKAELVLIGTDDGVVLLSNPGGIGRWLKSAHALRGQAVVATWAHPNDPTQMLCSNNTHLWRSTDGGQQWTEIEGPACQRLIASRSTPERIWAHDSQHAYLSHDAGFTWQVQAPATYIAGGGDTLWYRNGAHGYLRTANDATWDTTPAWAHVVISHDGQHVWHTDDQQVGYAQTYINGTPADFVPLLAGTGAPYLVGTTPTEVWRYTSTWEHIDAFATHQVTVMTSTIYHPDRGWAGDSAGNVWYSSDRCMTWELVRGGFTAIRALATARLL